MTTFYQSDVSPIKSIVLKHPKDAFVSDEAINRQWQGLNYLDRPDLARAVDEYERFVTLLNRFDIDLHFLPRDESVGLDSMYARDVSIVCSKGVIICNMGKAERSAEPAAQEAVFHSMGIPIHGAITGNGRVEGGDVAWIHEKTLAVGRGYRTNDEGRRRTDLPYSTDRAESKSPMRAKRK